jgi:hypothetical protein
MIVLYTCSTCGNDEKFEDIYSMSWVTEEDVVYDGGIIERGQERIEYLCRNCERKGRR